MAGLRSVNICDFDPRLDRVPVAGDPFCPDVVRLTSLFGVGGGGAKPGSRIGTPEPCEKVREGDSGGAMLDLGLPCCDSGRIDSRLIHEPPEETESRMFSTIGRDATSLCRMKDCLRPVSLADPGACTLNGRCVRGELATGDARGLKVGSPT